MMLNVSTLGYSSFGGLSVVLRTQIKANPTLTEFVVDQPEELFSDSLGIYSMVWDNSGWL